MAQAPKTHAPAQAEHRGDGEPGCRRAAGPQQERQPGREQGAEPGAGGVRQDVARAGVPARHDEVLQRLDHEGQAEPGERRATRTDPGQAQHQPERQEHDDVLDDVLHALVAAYEAGNGGQGGPVGLLRQRPEGEEEDDRRGAPPPPGGPCGGSPGDRGPGNAPS